MCFAVDSYARMGCRFLYIPLARGNFTTDGTERGQERGADNPWLCAVESRWPEEMWRKGVEGERGTHQLMDDLR